MEIITKLVLDWETGAVLERESYQYEGAVALCKGASSEQESQAKITSQFASKLMDTFTESFGESKAIMQSLNTTMSKLIHAGATEEVALRTQASEGTAKEFESALKAQKTASASAGGGNVYLPSGAEAQLESGIYQSAAAKEAEQQLGVTKTMADVNRQIYGTVLGAQGQLFDTSSKNALQIAQLGLGGSEAASTAQSDITKANQAGSWTSVLGGLVGGGIGKALGV